MWVVIALGAFILVVLLITFARADIQQSRRRKEARNKPTYRSNHNVYALADWYVACKQSLNWSRKRRGKES